MRRIDGINNLVLYVFVQPAGRLFKTLMMSSQSGAGLFVLLEVEMAEEEEGEEDEV